MSRIITRETVLKVKEQCDLADYVAAHTKLEASGENLIGTSPLVPNDPGKSLTVFPKAQRFKCKASGAAGDVIAFEQALSGTNFVDTVEFLAMLKGIQLKYAESSRRGIEQMRRNRGTVSEFSR